MKSRLVSTLLLGLLLTASSPAQTAPTAINFQGRLTRLDGKALPDGQYTVTMRLWKDLTSTNSNDLLITWSSLSVQVRSGVFATALPNLTEAVLAGGVAYLEIEPTGQPALSPRVPLLSVPYAVLAGTVFDGAISSQKLKNDVQSITKVTAGKVTWNSDSFNVSGGLIVDAPAPSGVPAFFTSNDVGGTTIYHENTADGATWQYTVGSSLAPSGSLSIGYGLGLVDPMVTVLANGSVGIGTSNPQSRLDVAGDIRSTGSVSLNDPMGQNEIMATSVLRINPASELYLCSSGVPRLTITGDGVGIGTVNPSVPLEVVGRIVASGMNITHDALQLGKHSGQGNPYFLSPSPNVLQLWQGELVIKKSGTALVIEGNAYKPGGGSWADLNSDRRLKTNIRPLQNPLYELLALQGVSYEFREPKKLGERPGMRRGFIAQDVERQFPDWVITKQDGYKTISFDSGFDALTVEAIRALAKKNSRLEDRVASLAAENCGLKTRLERLERFLAKR